MRGKPVPQEVFMRFTVRESSETVDCSVPTEAQANYTEMVVSDKLVQVIEQIVAKALAAKIQPNKAEDMIAKVSDYIEKKWDCPDFRKLAKPDSIQSGTFRCWGYVNGVKGLATAVGCRKAITGMAQLVNEARGYLYDLDEELDRDGVDMVMPGLLDLHQKRGIIGFMGPIVSKVALNEGGLKKYLYVSYPLIKNFEGFEPNEI